MSLYTLTADDGPGPDGVHRPHTVHVRHVWGSKGRETRLLTVKESPTGEVKIIVRAPGVTVVFEPEPETP